MEKITNVLKKQVKLNGDDLVEQDRKSDCIGLPVPTGHCIKLTESKTVDGFGIAKKSDSTQKISPPKKRTPMLGQLLQTPSMEKSGGLIVYSADIEDKDLSFDFGELSSVSDSEEDTTVRVDITIQ